MPVSHPDHMHTGEATIRAVYPDARNPFAHVGLLREEGLAPWSVPEIWVTGSKATNHAVDVTDVMERKMTALASHVSQFPQGFDGVSGFVREWMAANAREAGLPGGRFAEVYEVQRIGV